MAYTKVPFDKTITDIAGKIDAAKTAGTYAGNESDWDKTMVDALTRNLELAKAQNDKANDLIVRTHAETKKWVDASTELAKKKGKKINATDVGVLENAQRLVAKHVGTLVTDSQDLMAALLEFRGAWPGEAKKSMSNPARIDPLVAARKESIDANVKTEALKTRVKEYDTRLTSLVSAARKVAGQAGSNNQTLTADYSRDVTKALALANKADVQPAVDLIVKLNPKVKLTPADLKFHEQNLASFQAVAKTWRGAMKTSEQLTSMFKKVSADFTGDAKKARDAALAKASTDTKAAAAKLKNVEKVEDKAVKNLKTVSKLR